jgi:arginyl-tRNA synthetase
MSIFRQVKQLIIDALTLCYGSALNGFDTNSISLEQPRDTSRGDLATNAAMLLAKPLGKAPKEIASKITNALSNNSFFTKVEIAGPGFINLHLHNQVVLNELRNIITDMHYGKNAIGQGIRVNLEFISANPTGPLHIGHLRNAFFGNALANLLKFSGYDVFKEFYVNDAGGQISVLAKSCFLRYRELCTGKREEISEGLYPGDYLIEIAQKIRDKYLDQLLTMEENDRHMIFQIESTGLILEMIKSNLMDLGIEFDLFFSERSLHDENKIQSVVNILQTKNLLYRGILDAPKEKVPDDWEPREQLLFRSTKFGDDIDRPLQKSDGAWTYFAGDIAYLNNKISRGFDELIFVLGADHGGYKARLSAASRALSDGKVDVDVKIMQLVQFIKNGEVVKMSKRAGNFLLASEVVREVGRDVTSFTMLTRSNEQALDFDFEKVKETTKDNPIFYVQYANARIHSLFRAAKNDFPDIHKLFEDQQYNLSDLEHPIILAFVKKLCAFPRIIEQATTHHEPHRIIFYLIEIAADFHQLWNLGREDKALRFLDKDTPEICASYLAVLLALRNVIKTGLAIFNVEPLESM